MPPRSFNGWRDWAMANLNYTMREAEEYALMRLSGQIPQQVHNPTLFDKDSERGGTGDHPPQDEARRSPQRQPRPPAPSKDSGRGTDGTREAGEDRPQASARPEYDPRSAPWPEDY